VVDATDWLMDRVVNREFDSVIILLVGVAIGFLRSSLEMPQVWRDGT